MIPTFLPPSEDGIIGGRALFSLKKKKTGYTGIFLRAQRVIKAQLQIEYTALYINLVVFKMKYIKRTAC